MEIWDLYRKDGTPAGCELVRGQPMPKGLFHIVSGVVVRHTDGTYLLMQRDLHKDGWPGLWEMGASGSILKGETPLQGAIRELKEECGLGGEDMELLFVCHNEVTFYWHYLCVTDCPKDSVTLQEGETIAYKWVSREELLAVINSDRFVPTQRQRWLPFLNQI